MQPGDGRPRRAAHARQHHGRQPHGGQHHGGQHHVRQPTILSAQPAPDNADWVLKHAWEAHNRPQIASAGACGDRQV